MPIAFDIPARFATNAYYRVGTTMRSHASGRIVAHLQETHGLVRMAGFGFDPASMLGNGIQIYQNEQIKAGLTILRNLQVANLALSGIGVGVSVAGFAVLARKLDRIESDLNRMAAVVDQVSIRLIKLESRLFRTDLAALRAELRRMDEAWLRTDAEAQWRVAADHLLTLEQAFHDHACELSNDADEAAMREQMIDAFELAGRARLSALLAAGETDAAVATAGDFSRSLTGLTGGIGAPQILRRLLAAEAAPADPAARLEAIKRRRPEAEARAKVIREREDLAATAPLTFTALARMGVSGREWLERARGEVEAPLICLVVEDVEADEPVKV